MNKITALCIAIAFCKPALADTFPFRSADFLQKLNVAIREDTPDGFPREANTVRGCQQTGDTIRCSFNEQGWRLSVAAWKQIGLINGRISPKSALTIVLEKGQVQSVTVEGDRADPVNLARFQGYVLDVLQAIAPVTVRGNAAVADVTDKLGLTRGDAAADIGQPRLVAMEHLAVRCLAVPSTATTKTACAFLPTP